MPDGPPGQQKTLELGYSDADNDTVHCSVSCNVNCTLTVNWCRGGAMNATVTTTNTTGLMVVTMSATDPWGAHGGYTTQCGY